MCDLFGMSCNEPDRASRSLPLFGDRSEQNPHGWGVAFFTGRTAQIRRQPSRARDSEEFRQTAEQARSEVLIAHVRLKTHGDVCESNCHPFKRPEDGADWVFAHNGQADDLPPHPAAAGTTDSERAFHFIMDEARAYRTGGGIRGTYPGIARGIRKLLARPEGGAREITLNFLMSDGSVLYAFSHYRRKQMYMLRREKDYGGAILISTCKLTDENWIRLPENRLLVVSRGQVLLLGKPIATRQTR